MFKKIACVFILGAFITLGLSSSGVVLADCDADSGTCLKDPLDLGGRGGVNQLIGRVISAVMGIVGSLALAMFVYGGFVWMLSAGNSEQVQKGKNVLIWASVGLVVIFSSYALVKFVLSSIA